MSESLGVEEKTIRVIVRLLREAGLFTTGARGVNAPDITPLDAVRVVIAVVASPFPSRAVRDVKYFGALKPDLREEGAQFMKPEEIDENETFENTLLAFAENRMPFSAMLDGRIRLSESGSAFIFTSKGYQEYHQRERWSAVMKELTPKSDEWKKAVHDWEHLDRISNTKVARSAEFPLEILHQIGFEIIGWDVD